MFHLLFWTFTSLLIILGFQLLSITAVILGGEGPSVMDNFIVLLKVLPIGACIFYASYYSLNFFGSITTMRIDFLIGKSLTESVRYSAAVGSKSR